MSLLHTHKINNLNFFLKKKTNKNIPYHSKGYVTQSNNNNKLNEAKQKSVFSKFRNELKMFASPLFLNIVPEVLARAMRKDKEKKKG